MTPVDGPGEPGGSSVDLYWIPLGAGHHSVRLNGVVYEALRAALERRARCDLYHSVLRIQLPTGDYWVEMTPVPDQHGSLRGVVAEGSVGLSTLGVVRLFRYETRRWRDGVIPDLEYAVESPIRVTSDPSQAERVFDLIPHVPTFVWGRDEMGVGDMWSCNSVISWVLATADIAVEVLPMPPGGRAPGWKAGIAIAQLTAPPN